MLASRESPSVDNWKHGRSGKVLEVAAGNASLTHGAVWKRGLYSQLPATAKWLRGDLCSFQSTSQGGISIFL